MKYLLWSGIMDLGGEKHEMPRAGYEILEAGRYF
jgi:hypothetical protein